MDFNNFHGRVVAQATSCRRGFSFFKISVHVRFVASQGVLEHFLAVYVIYRLLLRKGGFC